MSDDQAPRSFRDEPPRELEPEISEAIPQTGILRSYLTWASKTTDAEGIFHVGSVLPCIANTAVEHGYFVGSDTRMRPSMWTFLVGVPAASKSTAQKRAEALYLRALTTAAGQQVTSPFISGEGSLPGMFEDARTRYNPMFNVTPGIIVRDEAARLLGQRDDSVADFLISLIDGGDFSRNLRALQDAKRAGGEDRSLLKQGALSGRMATTFARLREVTTTSHLEGGLYSRFLWCVGKPYLVDPRYKVDLHVVEQKRVHEEWVDWMGWLLAERTAREIDPREGEVPGLVSISAEADDLFHETIYAEYRANANAKNAGDPLIALRKRAVTQAQIASAIYALTERSLVVSTDHAERAVKLLRLSIAGLEQLAPRLAQIETNEAANRLHELVRQLEADCWGVSRSDLYACKLPRRELQEAIEQLLDAGRLFRVEVPATGRPGRPVQRYISDAGLQTWGTPQATAN